MYEFKMHANNKSKPMTFIFVIDVSYTSVQIGFMSQILASIKNSLDYFPVPNNTNIGFITYNNSIHFYSYQNASCGDPTMVCMNNIYTPFFPFPADKLLVNLGVNRSQINTIIDKISAIHNINKIKPINLCCGGAALKCTMSVLKESGGKIVMFCHERFNNGIETLPFRDNATLYNSDKEKTLKTPLAHYVELANNCIKNKIGVDVFACNSSSIDFASLAALCGITGGEAYHYSAFTSIQSEKLYYDIFRNLTRNYAFDVTLTVRTSKGIRPVEYYGGFLTKADKVVELSMVDSDKTMAVSLKVDGKLIPDADYYVQFAFLYTHISGERRTRIFNNVLSSTACSQLLYSNIDGEATLNIMVKEACISLLKCNLNDVKEKIIEKMSHMLWYYRMFVSQSAHSTQFLLPEALKCFPLYVLGLFKSQVFMNLKEASIDQNIFQLHHLISCHLSTFVKKLYPKLYQITNIIDPRSYCDKSEVIAVKPQNICAIKENLLKTDAYLMDSGEFIYLYLGTEVPLEFMQQVLGVTELSSLKNYASDIIPELDTLASKKLRAIIEILRKERQGAISPSRIVVAGNEKHVLYEMITEDAIKPSDESYKKFLVRVHECIIILQSSQ